MKATTTRAVAGLFWLLAAIAVAGDRELPAPPSFAEVDTNGDQYVDADELSSFMQQRWEQRHEHFKGDAQRPERRPGGGRFNPIERADTDGDGMLNETEFLQFIARMQELFERLPREEDTYAPGEA